jgi:hypothetical protein
MTRKATAKLRRLAPMNQTLGVEARGFADARSWCGAARRSIFGKFDKNPNAGVSPLATSRPLRLPKRGYRQLLRLGRDGETCIMLSPRAKERRRAPRYSCERLAKIHLGRGDPPRSCLITDFSDGGVRVNTFGFDIPDEFVLLAFGDGPDLDGTYKVVWRLGLNVGAKFIGREIAGARDKKRPRRSTARARGADVGHD